MRNPTLFQLISQALRRWPVSRRVIAHTSLASRAVYQKIRFALRLMRLYVIYLFVRPLYHFTRPARHFLARIWSRSVSAVATCWASLHPSNLRKFSPFQVFRSSSSTDQSHWAFWSLVACVCLIILMLRRFGSLDDPVKPTVAHADTKPAPVVAYEEPLDDPEIEQPVEEPEPIAQAEPESSNPFLNFQRPEIQAREQPTEKPAEIPSFPAVVEIEKPAIIPPEFELEVDVTPTESAYVLRAGKEGVFDGTTTVTARSKEADLPERNVGTVSDGWQIVETDIPISTILPVAYQGVNREKSQPPLLNGTESATKVIKPVTGFQELGLRVTKRVPANVSLHQPSRLELELHNEGDSLIDEVVISETVPASLRVVDASPGATLNERTLEWTILSLKPAESRTLHVEMFPLGEAIAETTTSLRVAKSVATQTEVAGATLALDVVPPESISVGKAMLVQFQIRNEGSAPAEDIVLAVDLPATVSHRKGTSLEHRAGTLQPGEERTVSLAIRGQAVGTDDLVVELRAIGGIREMTKSAIAVQEGTENRKSVEPIPTLPQATPAPSSFCRPCSLR